LSGHVVVPLSAHIPHAATYDGWIVSYGYVGKIASGSSLSTQWVVPLPPLTVGDQDIAFFNDIETTAGGEDILQPVLDFSEIPGHWAIESEHCCISGIDEQSTLVEVTPGDLILGVVMATGCDATGVCESWTVTTTDVTTGKSTVLNTSSPMGVPNTVNPGALETYGVTSCDMFPASGEETFIDNTLADPDGGVETLSYLLDELSGSPASLPACGYGGSMSGNSYTLIFSPSPTGNEGAGPSDASEGASQDASQGSSGGVDPDASHDGSIGSSGSDSGGQDSGLADGDGMGLRGDSGSAEDEDSASNAGNPGGASGQSSGCGCALAGAHGRFRVGPLGVWLFVGAWRRRVRTRATAPRRTSSRTRWASDDRADP
jgi:hypothetical protein